MSIIMEFARDPHVDPSDRRQVCKALSLTHSNAEPLTPTCFTLPGGAGGEVKDRKFSRVLKTRQSINHSIVYPNNIHGKRS